MSAPTPTRSVADRLAGPMVVLVAIVVLLGAYGMLSLANDPRGTLGTDTGGKLATLATMERNQTLDPDLGYWAEDLDPQGRLHPLWYTSHLGDKWVNVTTLPMMVVAAPLHNMGGPRAVLLLPMVGAVLAALAGRALAMRIGGGNGWWAFWTVGLASPVAVYALDFWEHAPGVAFALWGIVFAYDVLDGRAGWRAAAASGLLFGLTATMRTEALVYAALTAGLGAVVLWRRRAVGHGPSWSRHVQWGVAWVTGLLGVLAANQLLERAVVGQPVRADRAVGTATMAGGGAGLRIKETLTTSIGLNRFVPETDWVVGALMVALVAYAAWRFVSPGRGEQRMGGVALVAAAILFVLLLRDGLGFVPGMLSASPLAAAGLVLGWSVRRWRHVGALALLAAPIVWVFQFTGGANPQWGGRYLLVSGTLLVVGAATVLPAIPRWSRIALVLFALLVTMSGVAWLSQRSHAVADAMRSVTVDDGTVLVSREAHLLREGGAFYSPDARWLTATTGRDLRRAGAVAAAVDAPALRVIGARGRRFPAEIGPWQRTERRRVEFLPGVDVEVVTYMASPA